MPADHEYDDTKLDSLHPFSTGIHSRLVQIRFYSSSIIGEHVCRIVNRSLKKPYCRESFAIAFYRTKYRTVSISTYRFNIGSLLRRYPRSVKLLFVYFMSNI